MCCYMKSTNTYDYDDMIIMVVRITSAHVSFVSPLYMLLFRNSRDSVRFVAKSAHSQSAIDSCYANGPYLMNMLNTTFVSFR